MQYFIYDVLERIMNFLKGIFCIVSYKCDFFLFQCASGLYTTEKIQYNFNAFIFNIIKEIVFFCKVHKEIF